MNILDLTVRELLEQYSIVKNLECGFVYGIIPDNLIDKLYAEYDLKDEPCIFVEDIIGDEFEIDKQPLTWEDIVKIVEFQGISKK